MPKLAFDLCVSRVLKNEGGYVNNPQDKGGETKYGITKAVAQKAGYNGNMRDMSELTAIKIYELNYWNKSGSNTISTYSFNLAFLVFDFGINSGVANAVKKLQKVLNDLAKTNLKIDGVFGKKTAAALQSISGSLKLVEYAYISEILSYYTALNQFGIFGKGWINRVSNNLKFLV